VREGRNGDGCSKLTCLSWSVDRCMAPEITLTSTLHPHFNPSTRSECAIACVRAGYKASFSSASAGRPQGSVLVLDVSSLWRKHPTQPQLSTPDAGECQERCSKLTGGCLRTGQNDESSSSGRMAGDPAGCVPVWYDIHITYHLGYSGQRLAACSGSRGACCASPGWHMRVAQGGVCPSPALGEEC
jgi:hypothetical protein